VVLVIQFVAEINVPDQLPLAVITGAAHRLGKAIALGLAGAGYAVGMHYYKSGEAAQQTALEIEALGVPVIPLQADLTDESQIAAIFAQVQSGGYPLRVLVNSAGIMPKGNLRTLAASEWDDTLALNLRAPWLCARYAAELMEAEGGSIVNLSDAGVVRNWTGYPAYLVSKSGLEMLTRLLARTLAPNIRVNAIAPGLIMPAVDLPESEWQRLVDRLPLKKSGSGQEIVQAVLFLLNNQYVTGQTLVIDGGYQLL
jgi:NAD(P)-dependent dehydrogenase (short-subunit alcohol dehydrogenase family)